MQESELLLHIRYFLDLCQKVNQSNTINFDGSINDKLTDFIGAFDDKQLIELFDFVQKPYKVLVQAYSSNLRLRARNILAKELYNRREEQKQKDLAM